MRQVMPEISWIAFAMCILTTKTIDQAFDALITDPFLDELAQRRAETEDMVKLKSEMSLSELGNVFNLQPNAVHKRIKRFKNQQTTGQK